MGKATGNHLIKSIFFANARSTHIVLHAMKAIMLKCLVIFSIAPVPLPPTVVALNSQLYSEKAMKLLSEGGMIGSGNSRGIGLTHHSPSSSSSVKWAGGPKSATPLRHVFLSAIATPSSCLVSPVSSSSSVTKSRFGRPHLRFLGDGSIEVTALLVVRRRRLIIRMQLNFCHAILNLLNYARFLITDYLTRCGSICSDSHLYS